MNTSMLQSDHVFNAKEDIIIKLMIAIFTVISSFFSDWLSQVLANLMGLEKSSSWTLVIILILAILSTQLFKVFIDKEFIRVNQASEKISLIGNSFSILLLVRVFSPCWSDCLTCEVQGPTAPLLKSGIALVPFLFSAGISYQAQNAKTETSSKWLNFSTQFDHKKIILSAIMEKIRKAEEFGKQKNKDVFNVEILEEDIVNYYRRNHIVFDNIKQIREQISLFIIDAQAKGGIPFGSHHYKLELIASKLDPWKIYTFKFTDRLH